MQIGVLGGGIIGLSIANWLIQDGHAVTLIERDPDGRPASFGNAGLVADYATIPMANPQLLRSLPGLLLDPRSSVSVRPGYWPAMISFGRAFRRATRQEAFDSNHRAMARLIPEACRAFETLVRRCGLEAQVGDGGCLWVYRGQSAWNDALGYQAPTRQGDGVRTEILSPAEVEALEPAIPADRVTGGVYYPATRHLLSPGAYCQALMEHFVASGGKLLQAAAERLYEDGDGAGLLANGQRHGFERLVVALGPHSAAAMESIGCRIPVVSERGYHITLEADALTLRRPVAWMEHHFFMTPMQDGVRVAGTTEFAPPEAAASTARWRRMANWVGELTGRDVRVASRWVGARAASPDTLPLIGPTGSSGNVILATGHGHLGVTFSAMTGQLVASLLAPEPDHWALGTLSPDRFARHQ